MYYLVQLDTNMTSKSNLSSAYFETLSTFQEISFTLFAYYYFKASWSTKLMMEGMSIEGINSRFRTVNIVTVSLIVALFVIKAIQMAIQAKYNSVRFLITDKKSEDCCHPQQRMIKSLQVMYLMIMFIPVTVLGKSLLMIRNITV